MLFERINWDLMELRWTALISTSGEHLLRSNGSSSGSMPLRNCISSHGLCSQSYRCRWQLQCCSWPAVESTGGLALETLKSTPYGKHAFPCAKTGIAGELFEKINWDLMELSWMALRSSSGESLLRSSGSSREDQLGPNGTTLDGHQVKQR